MTKSIYRSRRKRITSVYTTGELNVIIDAIVHPFFDLNPNFLLVDGMLHALVEQNPPLSIRKFVINNLPRIIDNLLKNSLE